MRRLLVFLKYPTPGQVKTRLAASLGDDAASGVYRACVELTLARLRGFQKEAMLCVEPADALKRTRAWVGPEWLLSPQQGRTLGDRLAHATAAALAEGNGPVVAIGTDSPWLEPSDLEEAFGALRQHDVVIGPSTDGGYYLVGLSRAMPALFDDIPWSTPEVYTETVAKARVLGVRVHTLREGYDIDQLADVQRFLAEESARGRVSAPLMTIAALSHRREPCRS